MLLTEDELTRFFDRIEISPSGCWEWQGAKISTGYGEWWHNQKVVLTHRVMHQHFAGPIESGHHVDHLCRNIICCNPDHLEAVSARENIRRGIGRSAINARKTHCNHGHEFTPENTHITSRGTRSCRACWSRQNAEYRARCRERSPSKAHALRTECPQGHAYDEVNTYTDKRGHRSCKACAVDRMRARRAKSAV